MPPGWELHRTSVLMVSLGSMPAYCKRKGEGQTAGTGQGERDWTGWTDQAYVLEGRLPCLGLVQAQYTVTPMVGGTRPRKGLCLATAAVLSTEEVEWGARGCLLPRRHQCLQLHDHSKGSLTARKRAQIWAHPWCLQTLRARQGTWAAPDPCPNPQRDSGLHPGHPQGPERSTHHPVVLLLQLPPAERGALQGHELPRVALVGVGHVHGERSKDRGLGHHVAATDAGGA